MTNDISAEQKQTGREYLEKAFSHRTGQWFTMEEIKAAEPTHHGIRALNTRGDEAVKDGDMINRFRAGKNYKEWSWLGHGKPEFFFFKLQNQLSQAFTNYSDLDSHVKKLLYKPGDVIELYSGTHEHPVFLTNVRLSPQDLLARGYTICVSCHGTGSADVTRQTEAPCVFCSGTGWEKKAAA